MDTKPLSKDKFEDLMCNIRNLCNTQGWAVSAIGSEDGLKGFVLADEPILQQLAVKVRETMEELDGEKES